MKKSITSLMLLFMGIFLTVSAFTIQKNPFINNHALTEFVHGDMLIKFKDNIDFRAEKHMNTVSTNKASINTLNANFGAVKIERVFNPAMNMYAKRVNKRKYRRVKLQHLENVYKITFSTDVDILSIIDRYKRDANVEYAEPNYIYHTSIVPNDPYYTLQWGLSQIQSEQGWDIEVGESSVVIAVIDTGIDWNHPDMDANIWINSGEDAWADPNDPNSGNGIDDDGNGFIDDYKGWDFVTVSSDSIFQGEDPGPEDNNPMDFCGHGTHVSGIAGAVTDNETGIAGVSWHCRIMALRAGYKNASGNGALRSSDIANAVYYAANMDANIVNMSFGSYSPSNIQRDALDYAYSLGILLVASAGNNGIEVDHYPSSFENVVSVAATDKNDQRALWWEAYSSNYGIDIDFAAPGSGVYSIYFDNTYASKSGTSMAAPFVSGLAGLILSNNPAFTNQDVREVLFSTTDPVHSDVYIGSGRINAYEALKMTSIPLAVISYPLEGDVIHGNITINGSAGGENFQNYMIEYGRGIYPSDWTTVIDSSSPAIDGTLATWDASSIDDGIYTLRLLVFDSNGNINKKRVTIYAGGSWVIERVDKDTSDEIGGNTSIAIDSRDHIHISYHGGSNNDLKYATIETGKWELKTVDSEGRVGKYSSIAIDSEDHVHISYLDDTNTNLKYATNASGEWEVETADSNTYVGWYTSIAIDSKDHVHISNYEANLLKLKYTTNASGSWESEIVCSEDRAGLFSSITLDSRDHVHISYYSILNQCLKYASNLTGEWQIMTLDNDGDVGYYSSIAIDSMDNIHISYQNGSKGDLKYATNSTGSWICETLESNGYVGGYTSITIDKEDHVHICYRDNTNNDFRYTTNRSGSWETEIVDMFSNTGSYNSIAIDTMDNVHISYYDSNSNDLKYATNVLSTLHPIAIAGPDVTHHVGRLVTLDGSGSYDPDMNYPLDYAWATISKPEGSIAALTNANTVNPIFTLDLEGDYTIQLVVTDCYGLVSIPDEVLVSTYNSIPVANAGADQTLTEIGSIVELDGTDSYDDDGDEITYSWAFITKPSGSSATLSDPNSATPTFEYDNYGDFIVELSVSDEWSHSEPDSVIISIDTDTFNDLEEEEISEVGISSEEDTNESPWQLFPDSSSDDGCNSIANASSINDKDRTILYGLTHNLINMLFPFSLVLLLRIFRKKSR
ncbi:MAG: S8 family serine peptidase [Spirochaetota bacterium]|nr:S8 family serine peptidase [Spirochaetota bacterium]